MALTRRPSLPAYLRLLHPFPSLLNALVVAALACIAVRGWPGTGTLVRLALAMLCIQTSIGALNDWADRDLDAATKPSKPIARGLIRPSVALGLAGALGVASVFLAGLNGPAAWALAMSGFGIGVAYDLGLKRTPLSALTYAVALPLIPAWVWTAVGRGSPALLAVLPVGFLLGIGLQLANALPDATGDEEGGVRGTLQWLGRERGRRIAWLSIAAALALALTLAPVVHLRPWPFVACWAGAAALLCAAILVYRMHPGPRSLQQGWSMLAPAAGLLAVGWLGSLP